MTFINNFTSIFIFLNCFYHIIEADNDTVSFKTKELSVFNSNEVEFHASHFYYKKLKMKEINKSGKIGWYNHIYYDHVYTGISGLSKTDLNISNVELTCALYQCFKNTNLFHDVVRVTHNTNAIIIGPSKFSMSFGVNIKKNKSFGVLISKNLKTCKSNKKMIITLGTLAIDGMICKNGILGGVRYKDIEYKNPLNNTEFNDNCKSISLRLMPIEANGELEVADIKCY